ncbi:hypothetical protein CVT24_004679 [Panaeolus cyanescens]|uniref:Uncharacterized protein n=1 Tax=Panaeolus cyanescens TaxID=181874 RepID=A0A409WYK4_9AGAR|nr:hypothetical protein CVT24_004679 [Panaeolus cyanescens]
MEDLEKKLGKDLGRGKFDVPDIYEAQMKYSSIFQRATSEHDNQPMTNAIRNIVTYKHARDSEVGCSNPAAVAQFLGKVLDVLCRLRDYNSFNKNATAYLTFHIKQTRNIKSTYEKPRRPVKENGKRRGPHPRVLDHAFRVKPSLKMGGITSRRSARH